MHLNFYDSKKWFTNSSNNKLTDFTNDTISQK